MKKILSIALFTILLTANQEILEDLNTTVEENNITQIEDVNLSELSEDELMAELMNLDEQIEDEKNKQAKSIAKTEAVMKLGRTVDELSKHLGVEK